MIKTTNSIYNHLKYSLLKLIHFYYIYIYIFHFPNKIEMAFNMVLTKLLHFPNSMNLNIKDNKIKNT